MAAVNSNIRTVEVILRFALALLQQSEDGILACTSGDQARKLPWSLGGATSAMWNCFQKGIS